MRAVHIYVCKGFFRPGSQKYRDIHCRSLTTYVFNNKQVCYLMIRRYFSLFNIHVWCPVSLEWLKFGFSLCFSSCPRRDKSEVFRRCWVYR